MYHKEPERVKVAVDKTLLKWLEKADKTREPIILECADGPTVVVLNLEEFESISATLEVEEDPELKEAIKEAEEDIRAGRIHTHEEVFGHPLPKPKDVP